MKITESTYSDWMVDNYRSRIPLKELQVMYPMIDVDRLGWFLVSYIFVLGLLL